MGRFFAAIKRARRESLPFIFAGAGVAGRYQWLSRDFILPRELIKKIMIN